MMKKNWIKTAKKIRNTVVLPAILYGTEAIPLTNALKKLNVATMQMMKFVKGGTKLDKMRNKEIRKPFEVKKWKIGYGICLNTSF